MFGRGFGRGRGRGFGFGRGFGRNSDESNFRGGFGANGTCYCPKCGYERKKVAGVPCRETKCPKCGSFMLRKD